MGIMSQSVSPKNIEVVEPSVYSFLKVFVFSAGAILAITGIAKIWSGLGNSKFLAVVDPIIGIKFGQLMLVVGVAEIVIALVCFFSKRQTLVLGLVAWMSTNFVVYRVGLWWMDWKKPCSCLGNLTDALHISPQTADNIMKVLLAYLLIGSYGLLIWQWRAARCVNSRKKINPKLSGVSSLAVFVIINCLDVNRQAMGAVFQAEGTLVRTVYRGDEKGSVLFTDSADFFLCVSNRQWFLKTEEEGGRYHFECGSDGLDSYYIVYDESQEPSRGSSEVVRPAVVTEGIYPEFAHPLAAVLWLAFASADYFTSLRTQTMPAPWASPMDDPSSLLYTYNADFIDEQQRLPKNMSWVVSKDRIEKMKVPRHPGRNYSDEMIASLSSYSHGTTGGVFRVLITTNFQGFYLPMVFELVRNFVPGPGVFERYSGTTKRILMPSQPVGPPNIRGKIGVSDYRWQDSNTRLLYLNYVVTNQMWKEKGDPEHQNLFSQRRASLSMKPTVLPFKRQVILALVLLLLVIPFSWMLLSKKKNSQGDE